MKRDRIEEAIYKVNRFVIKIRFNHSGEYLGYAIQKPRNEKKYYQRHIVASKASATKWQQEHKEERAAYMRGYMEGYKDSEEYKKAYRRSNLKRNNKGFIPLNTHFEGSEGHHISKDFVIFIPRKLHRAIYHDLLNNIGMDRVNLLAFSFLLCKQRIPLCYGNAPPLGKRKI